MKRSFLPILLAILVAITFLPFASGCKKEASEAQAVAKFHCPMHPTYTSARPGDCPICGMRLVPIKDGGTQATAEEHAEVPGRVAIMVSPEKRQLIGLVTSKVEERPLVEVIRAVGTVAHDERRFFRVAPRYAGWVEELFVNYTGQTVEKGEPLFRVYSPELFAAQNEYLAAFRNSRQNVSGEPLQGSKGVLESARRRLMLLQVSEEEIAKLEKTGEASSELMVRSPASGHVLTKNAVEGQAFNAGETLYEIADLHHLWVLASLTESELGMVKTGQQATVTFPNLGNRTFEPKISFISPHLDPQTRRGEARLEIENPGHIIRPDMWANVEITADLGRVLSVPSSAILDTGIRKIAFVDRPDHHLEPREVKTGSKTDEYTEVLEGLKEGESVVSRALFLIDSESQLKAAISGMAGGSSPAPESASPGAHSH